MPGFLIVGLNRMLVKQETNQRLDPRGQGEKAEEEAPSPFRQREGSAGSWQHKTNE